MKIIDQSHEIISLPDNLLGMIEAAGRTCYKSENKIGCTKKWGELCEHPEVFPHNKINQGCTYIECQYHSSQKFTKMLIKKGHTAMLEFCDITVRFTTNRGNTHEMVRHRVGMSYAQESTRYVRYAGNMEFIKPVWCSNLVLGVHTINWVSQIGIRLEGQINPELPPAENIWFWNQAIAERDYCSLLNCGWRPEQAREVLPNSLKTEIVVKGTLRAWMHMLKLRTSPAAHPQFRALLKPLLEELKQRVPVVFDDI